VVSFFKDLAIWIVPTNARLYLLDLLGGKQISRDWTRPLFPLATCTISFTANMEKWLSCDTNPNMTHNSI
jgi:hypothetical protein